MEPLKNFLLPRYGWRLTHQYKLRQSILRAVGEGFRGTQGTILDLGCGLKPYESILRKPRGPFDEYVGMDLAVSIYSEVKPDVVWDGVTIPFPENSFDAILCSEVMEHATDPALILREALRVLKPGGTMVLTTPFFWILHEVPCDERRLTPFGLDRLLREAGYTSVHVRALGGWDASLAQMLGLWIELRPMKALSRFLCRVVLGPLVWLLNVNDRTPREFTNWSMITGISATATKEKQAI